MVKPLDESQLETLPMSRGHLQIRFENRRDLATQRRDFLADSGLFIRTSIQPKPFAEFTLEAFLPDRTPLPAVPARLVQVVPYGEPGLMLQILRMDQQWLAQIDQWLADPATGHEQPEEEPGEDRSAEDDSAEDDSAEDDPSFWLDNLADMDEGEADLGIEGEGDRDPNGPGHVNLSALSRVALLEELRKMTPNERCRLAKRANRVIRSILMRDSEATVVFFLLKNPQISRQEVLDISKMTTITHQSVSLMLSNKQWSNSEELRHNLVRNPKTPVSIALKLVNNLNMKHLRELAKDWGTKTQIKQLALRLVIKRGGGE